MRSARFAWLLAAALPVSALALPAIEPGQWEVMTVKAGEQPFLHRTCFKADHLNEVLAARPAPGDGCTDVGLRQRGKAQVRELRCTNAQGQVELRRSAWTWMSPTHLENTIERVSQGHTTHVAQLSMVRAGPCPDNASTRP